MAEAALAQVSALIWHTSGSAITSPGRLHLRLLLRLLAQRQCEHAIGELRFVTFRSQRAEGEARWACGSLRRRNPRPTHFDLDLLRRDARHLELNDVSVIVLECWPQGSAAALARRVSSCHLSA